VQRSHLLVFALVAASPLLLCSTAAASSSLEPSSAAPHASMPPELQALEQKMGALELSTERVSQRVVLEDTSEGKGLFPAPKGKRGHGGSRSHMLESNSTGMVRIAPLEASFSSISNGIHLSEIQVGGVQYVHEPNIASHDGGRPWVRSKLKLTSSAEDDPGLFGGLGDGSSHFAELLTALGAAEGLEEAAPATIDGQPASHFIATYAPGEYPTKVITSDQRALLKALGKPSVKLDVYLSSAGLPLRRTLTLSFSKLIETVTVDITEINIPMASLAPPPASRTISLRALLKIELAQLTRLAEKKASSGHKRSGKH
jgi:hypothetical protein